MSHANGEVIRDGRTVGWFEYNGTGDYALRRVFGTYEELHRHWRTEHAEEADCVCGEPPADVTLYTDYGGGFHWPAKACLRCSAIVDGTHPYPDDADYSATDGRPPASSAP